MFGALSNSMSLPGIALYGRLSKADPAEEMAKFAKRPEIAREIQYFRDTIGQMQTPDDFLKNRRLLRFALSAYNMESQVDYPGRLRQVVMSDPQDRFSVANRMADDRYRQIAADFAFVTEGMDSFKDPQYIEFLVQGYLTNEYEKDVGKLKPALTDAMYFRRKIGSLSKTSQLYGDIQLFDVVKEGLGIPNSAVLASVERLTERIERGFDISRAQDPAYVDNFVKRYLAMKDMNAQGGASGSSLIGIFA
jgi:hypothetical protein